MTFAFPTPHQLATPRIGARLFDLPDAEIMG